MGDGAMVSQRERVDDMNLRKTSFSLFFSFPKVLMSGMYFPFTENHFLGGLDQENYKIMLVPNLPLFLLG